METRPQYWREHAISHDPKDIEDPANAAYVCTRPDGTKFINWYNPSPISHDPKDIEDPANAPYLYEGSNGEKFIDWSNPGHKLERWTERIAAVASGDEEKIRECYEREYYNRLIRRHNLGPDHQDKKATEERGNPTVMPDARPPIPAEEALELIKGLKQKIQLLEGQKNILALAAAGSGCPETATHDCPLKERPVKDRLEMSCANCWRKYAEEKMRVIS